MKKTITIVFITFLYSVSLSQSIAPSVVNAAGGYSGNGYYYMEWSIGEMAMVNQLATPDNKLIVTNGFIQPYLLKPANWFPYSFFSNDEIKIFPNPASKYIEINFFTKEKGKLTLHLFDASGKESYAGEIISSGVDLIKRIPVSHLSSGVYMLHIELEPYSGYTAKKGAYKIVKIQ